MKHQIVLVIHTQNMRHEESHRALYRICHFGTVHQLVACQMKPLEENTTVLDGILITIHSKFCK